MFAVRGIAISFSVFLMVYCAASIAVSLGWRWLTARIHENSARDLADFFFALRIFPFLTAVAITGAFTVPSFLLLEPRSISEPVGLIPGVLAFCGAAFGAFGVLNAASALRRVRTAIALWTRDAQPIETAGSVPILKISGAVPPVTVAGILRARVLLSDKAQQLLSRSELRTALKHELAHVRRRDNFRKLLLRFVAFPGMRPLESAWFEATEMAADDAAVASSTEALDLAAALVKLSQFAVDRPADLTAALVHCPPSAMNARVTRLIAWNERLSASTPKHIFWYRFGAVAAAFALLAVAYAPLLVRIHTATEWLVR